MSRGIFLTLSLGLCWNLCAQVPGDWNLTEGVLNSGQSEVLRVESLPGGSEVFLGGQLLGLSPLEIPMKPGQTYTLKVQKEFFVPKEISFTFPQGRRWNLKPLLTQAFGEVKWKNLPQEAKIYLLSLRREFQVSGDSMTLPQGEHTAEVLCFGYEKQVFRWTQRAQTVELEYQPKPTTKGAFTLFANYRLIPLDIPNRVKGFRLSLGTSAPDAYFWEIYGPEDKSPRLSGKVKTQSWTTIITPWAEGLPGSDWPPGNYRIRVYPQQKEDLAREIPLDLIRGQELGWTTGVSGVSGTGLSPGAGVRGLGSVSLDSGYHASWSSQGFQIGLSYYVMLGLPWNLELALGAGGFFHAQGPQVGFNLGAGLKQTWLGDSASLLALGPWFSASGAWTPEGTSTLMPGGVPREGLAGGLALRLGSSQGFNLNLSPGLAWGPRNPPWDLKSTWAGALAYNLETWGLQFSGQGEATPWTQRWTWEKASLGIHGNLDNMMDLGLNLGADWNGQEVTWSLGLRTLMVF